MSHVRNYAIVVCSEIADDLGAAFTCAVLTFPVVSEITPKQTNGSRSFFIPPDGSKRNWPEALEGDRRREFYKEWLRKNSDLLCVSWVELYFGGDDDAAAITDQGRLT